MGNAYELGRETGSMIRDLRAHGDDYDPRWDLADAAKAGADYFSDFKRGLEDGLREKEG